MSLLNIEKLGLTIGGTRILDAVSLSTSRVTRQLSA